MTVLERSLQDLRPLLWRALAYSSAVSVLVLAPFYYMLEVYGRVVDSRSLTTLGWLLLMLVLMLALMEALDWLRKEWMALAASQSDTRISQAIYQSLLQRNQTTGHLPAIAPFQDLKTLRETLQSPALFAVLELPASLVFLSLLYGIHPMLALAALAGVALFVSLRLLQHRYNHVDLETAQKSFLSSDRMLQDFVDKRQSALAMGMTGSFFTRWTRLRRQGLLHWTQASDLSIVFNALNKALHLIFSSGLMGLSAYLLLMGNLPAGAGGMILASTLGGRLLAPLGVLIANGKSLTQAQQAWQRLHHLLDQYRAPHPSMPLPRPEGRLELDNFSLSYPGQKSQVLQKIHFQLSPGELLLVVGASGSGKSTLARALIGLLPGTHGHARLDGAELFDRLRNDLGPHCGYLPQSMDLQEGTLAQNISRFTAGNPSSPSTAGLQACVQDWQLQSIVNNMPQGLDAWLQEGGANLSGGEKQKVALARAYYGSPTYVVLDEPDSSLDDAALKLLIEQLERHKKKGVTQIVISHRPSLAQVADKVLVLHKGCQQTFGPASQWVQPKSLHANP